MKSMFNKATRTEISRRIATLNRNKEPLWGAMNIYQMVKHCVLAERHYHGKLPVVAHERMDQADRKKLLALVLAEGKPMIKNAHTADEFMVAETDGDFEAEITRWLALISAYESFRPEKYMHWYFGPMSRTQLGQLSYKHNDHHLRQFGS